MATTIDPASRLEALLGKLEPVVLAAFLNMLGNIKNEFTLRHIVTLLESNQPEQAVTELVQNQANVFANSVNSTYIISGTSAAEYLNTKFINISFDVTNFRAVRQMQESKLRLIREFTSGQRDATRLALTDGIQRGLNPIAQARNFKDSIGLTIKQQEAVIRYRTLLETLDSDALRRELRDKRFDRTVQRAIRTETHLTKAQIDRMVNRYREKFIKFRSETIARTEALRSVHQGTEELYAQAIESGTLDAETLERKWVTAKDERVRSSHMSLNGVTRKVGETFPGENGPLKYPGDPEAPASETIRCRCVLTTRIIS